MTNRQLIVYALIAAPFALAISILAGLLMDGTISLPDLREFAQRFTAGTVGAAQIAIALSVVILALMAAIAPIIYAARSRDLVTFLISLAMTTTALALLVTGRSVFDQITALMIYLANIILAAIVYAAYRIVDGRR